MSIGEMSVGKMSRIKKSGQGVIWATFQMQIGMLLRNMVTMFRWQSLHCLVKLSQFPQVKHDIGRGNLPLKVSLFSS